MKIRLLTDMRRKEEIDKMIAMPDRDMCEMIRAHFESHPTLPGEKALKNEVNQKLKSLEPDENGFVPAAGTPTPFDNEEDVFKLWDTDEKKEIADKFAKTRIRETPLKEVNEYLTTTISEDYNPIKLKRMPLDKLPQNGGNGFVYIDKVNVELQRLDDSVHVIAEQSDGTHRFIGHLPDTFLKYNPMNVEFCSAELEIADYSNGKMKNISTRIVVDTDVMSGDVIDLDNSVFTGIYQKHGDDLSQ